MCEWMAATGERADEIARLRAEVEELTQERDDLFARIFRLEQALSAATGSRSGANG